MKRSAFAREHESGQDDQVGRSATFKVAIGFIGVLSLTIVGLTSSYMVGPSMADADEIENSFKVEFLCVTTNDSGKAYNGDAYFAKLDFGVYVERGCGGFFVLDAVATNNEKVYFEDCAIQNTGACKAGTAELTTVTHSKLSDRTCAREDKYGDFRLVNSCQQVPS